MRAVMYYGLLLFFLNEYVRIGGFIPGADALHVNSVLPLAIFAGTLFAKRPVSNGEVLKEANTWMFVTLLGLICASVLVAAVTMNVVGTFTTVLGYTAIYYVIVRQATDLPRIKGLFKALILVHLILIAITPEMLTSPDTRHYLTTGTFLGDGNDFALSVLIAMPLALFLFGEAKSTVGRLAAGGSLLLLLLSVVATQSRGATIGLGAVALYYWWKSPRKLVTVAGAVVALAVGLAFAPPQYFQRMNSIAEYETDRSAQGRIDAWKAGNRMMLSNPLLGVGAGQFEANFTRFTGERVWRTAHSIYFLILGELGLPGILLLLSVIIRNLTINRRLSKLLRARGQPATSSSVRLLACLSASMIAYAVAGAFLSAVYYPHMFVLAGLMTAAQRLARAAQPVAQTVSRAPEAAGVRGRPAAAVVPRPRRDSPRLIPEHGRFF